MSAAIFTWSPAEQLPSLLLQQVHVFAWDLDIPPHPEDWIILSNEELLRARRLAFPQLRGRYVRAHSVMRRILADACGIPAEKVPFVSDVHGKPEIEIQRGAQQVHFNLSHSAGMAVLAVSRSYPLGIDLELLRPIEGDVAEHHFSARELMTLRNLPAEQWLAGFYRCWTSKEALLKGEGLGLHLPLASFDVEADPQRPPALLPMRLPAGIASEWSMVELKPAETAIATLAVRNETGTFTAEAVRCFSLRL